jgi:hypothetical protein
MRFLKNEKGEWMLGVGLVIKTPVWERRPRIMINEYLKRTFQLQGVATSQAFRANTKSFKNMTAIIPLVNHNRTRERAK